jgi:hypothetical protein
MDRVTLKDMDRSKGSRIRQILDAYAREHMSAHELQLATTAVLTYRAAKRDQQQR